jgi:hypothetical protein
LLPFIVNILLHPFAALDSQTIPFSSPLKLILIA